MTEEVKRLRVGMPVLVDGERLASETWKVEDFRGDLVVISITYESGQSDQSYVTADRLTPLVGNAR